MSKKLRRSEARVRDRVARSELTPSSGHAFGSDLRCTCGASWFIHRGRDEPCPLRACDRKGGRHTSGS
jgi:hypothetical protein